MTINPSTPICSSQRRPSAAPITNAAVASASATIADGAITVTLAAWSGEPPVRGSKQGAQHSSASHPAFGRSEACSAIGPKATWRAEVTFVRLLMNPSSSLTIGRTRLIS